MSASVPILKDAEQEHPVPSAWRATLRDMAEALKDGNFALRGLPCVDPLDDDTATGIARSIAAYGCTLCSLPEESWHTSVCLWQHDRWGVLVDLFSVEEGRSDLVLDVDVYEEGSGFGFRAHFVYVP